MQLQHILFTTDLSDESLRPAIGLGALARREGTRITLLHVVSVLAAIPHGSPMAPPQSPPNLAAMHKAADERLVELRNSLPEEVEVQLVVLESSDPPATIADYAKQNQVDLIALSTHGRSGLRRMVLGSVAESILRHVNVPVLAFPPSA